MFGSKQESGLVPAQDRSPVEVCPQMDHAFFLRFLGSENIRRKANFAGLAVQGQRPLGGLCEVDRPVNCSHHGQSEQVGQWLKALHIS